MSVSPELANIPQLQDLVRSIEAVLGRSSDELDITAAVAPELERILAEGLELPESVTRPGRDHYVMYPLYIDPDDRFCIASAVWGPGQITPVHGHETWGVVGIHSGVERETRFDPREDGAPGLAAGDTEDWQPGQVTICCTTDADIHRVSSVGDQACVGIHVYGTDIGTLSRRKYDPETGEVSWFTSAWSTPVDA